MLSKETISIIETMRRHGFSIPQISERCSLPRSTVSRHARNIPVLPGYQAQLLARRNASKIISEREWQAAKEKVLAKVPMLTEKDLYLFGAALYWAEGSKKDFSILNSDPRMIRLFMYIMRSVFRVQHDRFKISLRIFDDLNRDKCLEYWSEITDMELDSKTSIEILHGSKNGKLEYGMCRIRVKKGGSLLKEFFSIINRVDSLTSPRSLTDRTAGS